MSDDDLTLEQRVKRLELAINYMLEHNGLVSPSFWRRVFTVAGYMFVLWVMLAIGLILLQVLVNGL